MKIAIIGNGAISQFVQQKLIGEAVTVAAVILRPGTTAILPGNIATISCFTDLPKNIDLLVDCAGHQALQQYAIPALSAGIDVLTVSIGSLADPVFAHHVQQAAAIGFSKLYLSSGAIGSLDALRAARQGDLNNVTYIGRKPPAGWRGSIAEQKIDLNHLDKPITHFEGNARQAALAYPKNANVAASVALSSLGFEQTKVQLIADPTINANIHEIEASGSFGKLKFTIEGQSLPDNPRSSALTAMGVVDAILKRTDFMTF